MSNFRFCFLLALFIVYFLATMAFCVSSLGLPDIHYAIANSTGFHQQNNVTLGLENGSLANATSAPTLGSISGNGDTKTSVSGPNGSNVTLDKDNAPKDDKASNVSSLFKNLEKNDDDDFGFVMSSNTSYHFE